MSETALELSGVQKAAILLVTLGDETGAELLKRLPESHVQQISKALANLNAVPSEQVELILEEFQQLVNNGENSVFGGAQATRKLLTKAFGTESAKKLLNRLPGGEQGDDSNLEPLQRADAQQLAQILENEHPQTIAILLSCLGAAKAGALLTVFNTKVRTDVAIRMTNLEEVAPETVQKIIAVLGQKLRSLGEFSRESLGGVRSFAEVVNGMDGTAGLQLLESIQEYNAELAETIRGLMFVFEDLQRIDQNGIRELVARVERKNLALALKGTSESLRSHFFSSMSKRGAEMFQEDMDALGPVKIRDVEAAQQKVIAQVRQMETEGIVSMKSDGEAAYVE